MNENSITKHYKYRSLYDLYSFIGVISYTILYF